MSEISLQAMQFVPRFIGVLILAALTWLVARFAKYMIQRAAYTGQDHGDEMNGFSQWLAKFSFWSIFVLMMPFILDIAGINISWLAFVQNLEGQVFANWPVWIILSLVVAGIWFVVQGIPKFFAQLKGSLGSSHSEVQS